MLDDRVWKGLWHDTREPDAEVAGDHPGDELCVVFDLSIERDPLRQRPAIDGIVLSLIRK